MSAGDRFRGRGRPSVPYLLPKPGMAAATRELRLAAEAWRVTLLRADEGAAQAVETARAALDAAQEAVAGCYDELWLTAMARPDFEHLVGEHPPREGSDDEKYNPETFPLAAFLACAPKDLSDAEWLTFLESNVSPVEYDELLQLAVTVNVRRVNPEIPKS